MGIVRRYMMLDNVFFLIVFGIMYGALATWVAWLLADNIFDKFKKYLDTKKSKHIMITRGVFHICWIISFGFFWIFLIYLSTFLPIKENLWQFFSKSGLITIFLTICILARSDKKKI